MEKEAIDQAKKRLRQMKNALALLEAAESFQAIDDAWSPLIMAYCGLYEKLRLGSKNDTRSAQWFLRHANKRKSDPLLNYLFQARHADYHGLLDVTKPIIENKLAMTATGKLLRYGTGELASLSVQTVELDVINNTRAGTKLHPPELHLGERVPDKKPVTVAKLAVRYLESLIANAEEFAGSSQP